MTDHDHPDPYTRQPTHLRLFTDGNEWFIDGADDEGRYTEMCWNYDTFREAVEDLHSFYELAQLGGDHHGVTWHFRPGRRARLRDYTFVNEYIKEEIA